MPESVRRLRKRAETGISVTQGSNKAIALSFLASHPGEGFTPSEIAAETELKPSSAPKTLQRLREDGLTVSIDGYHFIPEDRIGDVRAALTNEHAATMLENRSRGEVEWDEPDKRAETEAEELVESLAVDEE